MVKARVGQHLKEVLLGSAAHASKSSNLSADLDFLSGQFKRLKLRIKKLIDALKAQHVSLLTMNESRFLVAKRVAELATDCPISGEAGTIPSSDDESPNNNNIHDLNSYMTVHHNLHLRQRLYCDRFSKHVVDYAIEWERVIVARVSSSLHHAEKLRRNLDHYQSKVDRIKTDKSRIIAQGKDIDHKMAERLSRNESKLSVSKEDYESYATDLAALMREVTARSWKDLHPILLKMTQFDATLASDEHQLLQNLNVVSNNLKKIANRYGLKPDARLKDLETLSSRVIVSAEEAATMPSHSSSRSNEKENDEAVVRDVVSSLLSKKTTHSTFNSQFTTPPTSHIGGGANANANKRQNPNNKAPPDVDEIGKALDDLARSPQNYNTRRSTSGNNLVGNNNNNNNNMEFTGKPRQMNRSGSSSRQTPRRSSSNMDHNGTAGTGPKTPKAPSSSSSKKTPTQNGRQRSSTSTSTSTPSKNRRSTSHSHSRSNSRPSTPSASQSHSRSATPSCSHSRSRSRSHPNGNTMKLSTIPTPDVVMKENYNYNHPPPQQQQQQQQQQPWYRLF